MSAIQGQSGEQGQQQQQRSHRRLTKTVSGAANNGSSLIRLTISAGNPALYTGNRVLVSGVGGTVTRT